MRAYGVGDAEPRPGDPLEHAVEWADRGARALVDDVRLAADLRRRGADAPVGAGAHGASPASGADAAGAPDWDALMADGHDRAARLSAGNEFDDVRLAADLRRRGADAPVGAGAHGASPASGADAAGAPDWDALMADGHDRAARLSAGNEFGFYDSWYESSYRDWLSGAQRKWRVDDGAYWSAEELEDFELMLEVCRQTGVVLVPRLAVRGAAEVAGGRRRLLER